MFGIALAGMVLTGASEPLFPALMQPLLDGSFVKRDTSNLYLIPAAVIAVFVLRGILTFVSSYAMSWVSNRLLMDLRESMFASLLRQPMRYYDDHSTGVLISKVSNDVGGMINAATSVLTILVRESIKVVGLLAWLFWLNWKLTMITLTCITNQLDRRAGTSGAACCNWSGRAKLAKATPPRAMGVAAAATTGLG